MSMGAASATVLTLAAVVSLPCLVAGKKRMEFVFTQGCLYQIFFCLYHNDLYPAMHCHKQCGTIIFISVRNFLAQLVFTEEPANVTVQVGDSFTLR